MIELTEKQGEAIAAQVNPTVFDPKSKTTFVLVRREVFERMRGLCYDGKDLSDNEVRLLLAGSVKENGLDEPGMEDFDK